MVNPIATKIGILLKFRSIFLIGSSFWIVAIQINPSTLLMIGQLGKNA